MLPVPAESFVSSEAVLLSPPELVVSDEVSELVVSLEVSELEVSDEVSLEVFELVVTELVGLLLLLFELLPPK